MLTFEFTGVEGRMTESEVLTSGMVGKTVQFLFDDSWQDLTKTVVFRAGEICRIAEGGDAILTIPADVLTQPFRKLYVGVCGTDSEGTLVIPTIMAEGPLIRYGADPTEDSTAENLPVWKKLQEQIGDLADLQTEAKENLVAAINEVYHRACTCTPSGSSSADGLSPEAAALLVEILRNAVYTSDQTATIDALEMTLGLSGEEEPPQESDPEVTLTRISVHYSGGDVPAGTALTELTNVVVTAHYSNGTGLIVNDYTLSGEIAQGENTITVSYEGMTATFTVTGIAESGDEEDPQVTMTSISATYSGGDVTVGTALTDLTGITVTAHYSDGSSKTVTDYTLSGTIAEGTNTITVSFEGLTATFTVTGIAESGEDDEKVVDQTETLEIVYTVSYPNVTTFAYTEQETPGNYAVAKRGNLKGGELSVDYDESYANNWNLNLYVFDADGNPYLQTDKSAADGSELDWGLEEPVWEAVGAGASFGWVKAPFKVQLPEGCSCIACIRVGSAGISDFLTWAKNGGITFTVTTYK